MRNTAVCFELHIAVVATFGGRLDMLDVLDVIDYPLQIVKLANAPS